MDFIDRLSQNSRRLAYFFIFVLTIIVLSLLVLHSNQLAISFFFLSIGCILFLYIDRKKIEQMEPERESNQYNLIFDLIFVILFLISLLILIFHGLPLFRPLSFFVCLALMFSLISIEIININEERISNYRIFFILIKAMITSFLFNSTFFIGVYSLNGDVSMHFQRVQSIVQYGTTDKMPGYSENPAYHLIWAISSMILGLDILSTRFVMVFISSLGVLFMYICGKILTGNEKASLYSALVFSFFTLTNRIQLQTEPLAFGILFPLLFYLLFCSRNEFRNALLAVILFVMFVYTHPYYSSLFVIWLSVLFLIIVLFKSFYRSKFKDRIINLLSFSGVLWLSKVVYSMKEIEWTVENFVKVITNPLPQTTEINPTFLYAKSTTLQFLCMHLSELTLVSLSTMAVFLLLREINEKNLAVIGSFIGFSLITVVGMFIEGQKHLAWGVSFRNFYLIALFLILFGGYALANLEVISKNRRIVISTFLILFFALSFFSIASQQTNNLDPVFYAGSMQSPQFISYAEIAVLSDLLPHLSENSVVLSDHRTLTHKHLGLIHSEKKFKSKIFSEPSLPELNEEYDYLILNRYSIDRGMVFHGVKKGLAINRDELFNEAGKMDKVWNGGSIELYYNHDKIFYENFQQTKDIRVAKWWKSERRWEIIELF